MYKRQTQAVQNAQVNVNEPNKPMFLFKPGVELRDIVDAVNQIGASPSALIAILEALKSAGSLRAELVIIWSYNHGRRNLFQQLLYFVVSRL